MRRVSFTRPSIIARHAAVCKFWRETALAAVNQRIVFEGFPIVIFGDHTLPAYDQTVQVNKEDDLDLVTDVDHLRFAARVQFCGHEKKPRLHLCARRRTKADRQQQSHAKVRLIRSCRRSLADFCSAIGSKLWCVRKVSVHHCSVFTNSFHSSSLRLKRRVGNMAAGGMHYFAASQSQTAEEYRRQLQEQRKSLGDQGAPFTRTVDVELFRGDV